MQRAYAALGLPYSSQTTGQAQAPQAPGQTPGAQNSQAQQQLPQQMRSINTIGKVTFKKKKKKPKSYCMLSLIDI